MAKSRTEIVVPQAVTTNLPAKPAYMVVEDDESLAEAQQYIRPPRLKMVQDASSSELKAEYGTGTLVILPNGIVVSPMRRDPNTGSPDPEDKPYLFTPIFFFVEWCCWNPIQLKGTVPAIRERSFDPSSQVARMAKDWNARVQKYPDDGNPQHKIIYNEHLNFLVKIHGVDEYCIHSFFRGEYKAGQTFLTQCKMRKSPLYGGVYAGHTASRKNNKGEWWGVDVANPPEGHDPWVSKEEFMVFQEAHEEFKAQHAASLIKPDYDQEEIDVPTGDDPM